MWLGPNLSGIDPISGAVASLFNPRSQVWADHFEIRGAAIIALTPTGRATVRVLEMMRLRACNFERQLGSWSGRYVSFAPQNRNKPAIAVSVRQRIEAWDGDTRS